jgi:hypothetical protein
LEEIVGNQRSSQKMPLRKLIQQYKQEKGFLWVKNRPTSVVQRRFDSKVIAFLVNNNLYNSFVETQWFQNFDSVTNPKYNIKSTHTMHCKTGRLLYKTQQKMTEVLQNRTTLPVSNIVSFTYSEWIKNNIEVSLSISYINKYFVLRKTFVAV